MGVRSRRDSDGDTVTVTRGDHHWVARDDATGVASQGETKPAALANLAEALELHERDLPDDVDEDDLETSTASWF